MALISLKAGAEIDVASGSELDGAVDKILNKDTPKPTFLPLVGNLQNGGPGVVFVGRPPTGRMWNILTVTLLGADDHTVETGVTAAMYLDCDVANVGLAECVIPALTVPSFMSISKGTLWAHPNADVAFNIVGASAGQQVICKITVAEWLAKDVTPGTTK